MDPEAESLMDWGRLLKFLVFGGAAFAVVLWKWWEKRTLRQLNERADELERDSAD